LKLTAALIVLHELKENNEKTIYKSNIALFRTLKFMGILLTRP